MKVIILEEVRGLGKKFEIKEVNNGYARNFLFPNNLAEPANPSSIKKIEEMKAEHDKDAIEYQKHLETLAHKISETKIQFELKKGKDGSIFGSINKESVLKALREHKLVTKERIDITLDHPIKELGIYTVPIDLKKGVTAQLKIEVLAEKAGK
jgi:large subunit ribosomal protein L9